MTNLWARSQAVRVSSEIRCYTDVTDLSYAHIPLPSTGSSPINLPATDMEGERGGRKKPTRKKVVLS